MSPVSARGSVTAYINALEKAVKDMANLLDKIADYEAIPLPKIEDVLTEVRCELPGLFDR